MDLRELYPYFRVADKGRMMIEGRLLIVDCGLSMLTANGHPQSTIEIRRKVDLNP